MAVRRVVTGHDDQGRSVVIADETSPSIPLGGAGSMLHLVWGRDDIARFPDDGAEHPVATAFPPPGGCRASLIELPPGGQADFDNMVATALEEFADPDRPGMHRTPSLDFDLVLDGPVIMELDGDEVTLNAGDIVVQNGTNHRWRNPGPGVARWAAFVIGAELNL